MPRLRSLVPRRRRRDHPASPAKIVARTAVTAVLTAAVVASTATPSFADLSRSYSATLGGSMTSAPATSLARVTPAVPTRHGAKHVFGHPRHRRVVAPVHPVTPATPPAPPAPLAAGCSHYTGNQLVACDLLPSFGFSTGEMPALVAMWSRESGWSTSSYNSGSGAFGIPQALPGSKMASAGSDWRTNPATQIRWGLGYIRSRYGSPSSAWAFWQAHGWY
jgi:hypothetical protein